MKSIKSTELRQKSLEDLRTLASDSRKDLFNLRFNHYTGQLTDVASIKQTRRNIARIETIIRERELAGSQG
jgi:large subunit ribosomal protein L29